MIDFPRSISRAQFPIIDFPRSISRDRSHEIGDRFSKIDDRKSKMYFQFFVIGIQKPDVDDEKFLVVLSHLAIHKTMV